MVPAKFEKLVARYRAGEVKMRTFAVSVEGSGVSADSMADAIETAASSSDWRLVQGLVAAVGWSSKAHPWSPTQRLAGVLTELLLSFSKDVLLEDVVDALRVLADPAGADALRAAADVELAGDDISHHFNRKCIAALAAIGSERSRELLHSYEMGGRYVEARDEAREALARLRRVAPPA